MDIIYHNSAKKVTSWKQRKGYSGELIHIKKCFYCRYFFERLLSNQNTVDYLLDLLLMFNPILYILLGQFIKWLNICFISLNSWSISLCKPFSNYLFSSKRHFKLTVSPKNALKRHQKQSCKNNLMPLFCNSDITLWSQTWPNSESSGLSTWLNSVTLASVQYLLDFSVKSVFFLIPAEMWVITYAIKSKRLKTKHLI